MPKSVSERLFSKMKINKSTGCWDWIGAKNTNGYGILETKGVQRRAHRLSYELKNGPIPAGMFACHHCDNPGCINPDHLFIGTQADNTADMNRKGRRAPGEKTAHKGIEHALAKLTEQDVLEIRAAKNRSLASLGRQYGVCYQQIARIISRESWSHI